LGILIKADMYYQMINLALYGLAALSFTLDAIAISLLFI